MHKKDRFSFSGFIEEPPVSLSFLAIGLITLILAIAEFSKIVGY